MHGILFVTDRLPRHLGHYVSRFKSKCTQAMHNMSVYSETQSRTETLWEEGKYKNLLLCLTDGPSENLDELTHFRVNNKS